MFQPATDDDFDPNTVIDPDNSPDDLLRSTLLGSLECAYLALLKSLHGLPRPMSSGSIRLHALKAAKHYLPESTDDLLHILLQCPEILDQSFAPASHKVFPTLGHLLTYHVHLKMTNLLVNRYQEEFK